MDKNVKLIQESGFRKANSLYEQLALWQNPSLDPQALREPNFE